MTQENLDSPLLSGQNTQPITILSAGEGGPGILRSVDDYAFPTASGLGTTASTYRLCRIPTYAKIKSVLVDFSNMDTSTSPSLAFDVNIAFSDNPYDGTPGLYSGAALNGNTILTATCIPVTGQAGGTPTFISGASSYTSANKLFGNKVMPTTSGGATSLNNQLLFNGAYAAGGAGKGPNVAWIPYGPLYPLYEFLGFANSQGYPFDPGGFFDLLFYVSTAAATGAAGNIHARVDYII